VIFNFLVGNNDAHGKNFSLLYRYVGTASLDTRLAPLYDVVSTYYYPELTRDMAMKIGGEYFSDRVSIANFEQTGGRRRTRQATCAKAVCRNWPKRFSRIWNKTGIEHPVAGALADQIREHFDAFRNRIRNG